jgi:hypothetical protein
MQMLCEQAGLTVAEISRTPKDPDDISRKRSQVATWLYEERAMSFADMEHLLCRHRTTLYHLWSRYRAWRQIYADVKGEYAMFRLLACMRYQNWIRKKRESKRCLVIRTTSGTALSSPTPQAICQHP